MILTGSHFSQPQHYNTWCINVSENQRSAFVHSCDSLWSYVCLDLVCVGFLMPTSLHQVVFMLWLMGLYKLALYIYTAKFCLKPKTDVMTINYISPKDQKWTNVWIRGWSETFYKSEEVEAKSIHVKRWTKWTSLFLNSTKQTTIQLLKPGSNSLNITSGHGHWWFVSQRFPNLSPSLWW